MPRTTTHLRARDQVRRCNFTLNNPSTAERAWVASLSQRETRLSLGIRYLVFQEEIAPTTNMIHYQGYIEWFNPKRPLGTTFKNTTSPYRRFSWHRADHPRASIAYAKKTSTRAQGGDHGEYGESAANRADTKKDVVDQLLAGVPLKKVIQEHPEMDFDNHEKFVAFHNRNVPNRNKCRVILLIGPSRCGKSSWVIEDAKKITIDKPSGTYYIVPDRTRHNGRWDWQNYQSQDSIIINEFDDKYLKVVSFKQFFDEFPYQIEQKGSCMQMKSNNIYLTTNTDIKYWYHKYREHRNNAVHVDAMEQRITQFFTIYDCRKNLAYDIEEQDEDEGENEPYMQMTLRPHPPTGFKFENLQSSFATAAYETNFQNNRDGLNPYGSSMDF